MSYKTMRNNGPTIELVGLNEDTFTTQSLTWTHGEQRRVDFVRYGKIYIETGTPGEEIRVADLPDTIN